MKKTAETIYDSLLIAMFFGIIVLSLFFTLQIQPKEIITSNTVMGMHYKFGESIILKSSNDQFVKQDASITDNFSVISVSFYRPVNTTETADICYIVNEQDEIISYDIGIAGTESSNESIEYFLIVNDREYPIYNNEGRKLNYIVKIKPKDFADISLKVIPKRKVNLTMELKVEIEKLFN